MLQVITAVRTLVLSDAVRGRSCSKSAVRSMHSTAVAIEGRQQRTVSTVRSSSSTWIGVPCGAVCSAHFRISLTFCSLSLFLYHLLLLILSIIFLSLSHPFLKLETLSEEKFKTQSAWADWLFEQVQVDPLEAISGNRISIISSIISHYSVIICHHHTLSSSLSSSSTFFSRPSHHHRPSVIFVISIIIFHHHHFCQSGHNVREGLWCGY